MFHTTSVMRVLAGH